MLGIIICIAIFSFLGGFIVGLFIYGLLAAKRIYFLGDCARRLKNEEKEAEQFDEGFSFPDSKTEGYKKLKITD